MFGRGLGGERTLQPKWGGGEAFSEGGWKLGKVTVSLEAEVEV